MTARPDKATEGRTEAAAVDQAIADVQTALSFIQYRMEDDTDQQWFGKILAALRVLADAVEELRGDYEKQREYADEQYRKALAAEAERDRHIRMMIRMRSEACYIAFDERDRLARQVADLEALGRELVANADKEKMVRREDVEAIRAALALFDRKEQP